MTEAPHAPWALRGEMVLAWLGGGGRGRADRLPDGLAALPGPAALMAVRYTASPVGPYLELSVGEPARLGLRPGLCTTTMGVSAPAAKVGNRLNWGLPAELATLHWLADGDERTMEWDERGVVVRARPAGPTVPALVPVRSTQRRSDTPVIVPRRLRCLVRWARIELSAPDDDPFAPWAGRHPGAVLHWLRILVHPARSPRGLLSSFRAPLSPEGATRAPDTVPVG